jgi:hypothetical protein
MNETSSQEPRAEQTPDDSGAAMPATLFRLHAQAVFAVCLANTPNYHDAEEVSWGAKRTEKNRLYVWNMGFRTLPLL